MRALYAIAAAGFALLAIGMPIALIGRAQDWSPYALVELGAGAGLLVGLGMTMFLYVTAEDDPTDQSPELIHAYRRGWNDHARAELEDIEL